MITSRDRVIRTLNHQPADLVPRDLWVSPATEMLRGDEVRELLFRYPVDIVKPEFSAPRGERARGTPYEPGEHTDAWGCTWKVHQRGAEGELARPPLADLSGLSGYRPPLEIVQKASVEAVNRSCAATPRFVLAWTETRPLDRLRWLHGAEATVADLACGARPIRELLSLLHDFSCREMEWWARTDVDGVVFRDDWGSEHALLIPADAWRDLFKPLYRQYCEILRARDKFVFFHSGGYVADLFPDLIEIGVDALHAPFFSMDLEWLAEQYRGQVTFWGEIDQRQVLPRGTLDDVRGEVRRLRKAVDYGQGGVIAQCEWASGVPFESMCMVFEQWLQPLPLHAQAVPNHKPR